MTKIKARGSVFDFFIKNVNDEIPNIHMSKYLHKNTQVYMYKTLHKKIRKPHNFSRGAYSLFSGGE